MFVGSLEAWGAIVPFEALHERLIHRTLFVGIYLVVNSSTRHINAPTNSVLLSVSNITPESRLAPPAGPLPYPSQPEPRGRSSGWDEQGRGQRVVPAATQVLLEADDNTFWVDAWVPVVAPWGLPSQPGCVEDPAQWPGKLRKASLSAGLIWQGIHVTFRKRLESIHEPPASFFAGQYFFFRPVSLLQEILRWMHQTEESRVVVRVPRLSPCCSLSATAAPNAIQHRCLHKGIKRYHVPFCFFSTFPSPFTTYSAPRSLLPSWIGRAQGVGSAAMLPLSSSQRVPVPVSVSVSRAYGPLLGSVCVGAAHTDLSTIL